MEKDSVKVRESHKLRVYSILSGCVFTSVHESKSLTGFLSSELEFMNMLPHTHFMQATRTNVHLLSVIMTPSADSSL